MALPWGSLIMNRPSCVNVTDNQDVIEAADEGGRTVLKRMFVKLIPGQHYDPHVDWEKERCPNRKRIHIPLTSNPDSVFMDGDTPWNFLVGRHYELDPSEVHAVYNRGNTDRIHYFFDYEG